MNTTRRTTGLSALPMGFTLIEVLIAILVLAIGLLGLGAVFPAVIAEQRDAFAVIEGENVASVAASLISGHEVVDFSLLSENFGRRQTSGGGFSLAGMPERYSYEWVVSSDGSTYYDWSTPVPGFLNFGATGLWSFNMNNSTDSLATGVNAYTAQIPVSARLYPAPYSGKEPRFVWDLALRRDPGDDRVEAAVFVRRIDARLRVPKQYTLSDVITGGRGYPEEPKLPVALDGSTGRIGVDDGGANMVYAAIQTLDVQVHPEHLDWLVFVNGRDPGIDTSVGFATLVGQKLLDNTGAVRTVVGTPQIDPGDPIYSTVTGNNRVVQVDPPFSFDNAGGNETRQVRPNVTSHTNDPEWDDERASWVRQVIFTPRIPVAIRLVKLEDSQ